MEGLKNHLDSIAKLDGNSESISQADLSKLIEQSNGRTDQFESLLTEIRDQLNKIEKKMDSEGETYELLKQWKALVEANNGMFEAVQELRTQKESLKEELGIKVARQLHALRELCGGSSEISNHTGGELQNLKVSMYPDSTPQGNYATQPREEQLNTVQRGRERANESSEYRWNGEFKPLGSIPGYPNVMITASGDVREKVNDLFFLRGKIQRGDNIAQFLEGKAYSTQPREVYSTQPREVHSTPRKKLENIYMGDLNKTRETDYDGRTEWNESIDLDFDKPQHVLLALFDQNGDNRATTFNKRIPENFWQKVFGGGKEANMLPYRETTAISQYILYREGGENLTHEGIARYVSKFIGRNVNARHLQSSYLMYGDKRRGTQGIIDEFQSSLTTWISVAQGMDTSVASALFTQGPDAAKQQIRIAVDSARSQEQIREESSSTVRSLVNFIFDTPAVQQKVARSGLDWEKVKKETASVVQNGADVNVLLNLRKGVDIDVILDYVKNGVRSKVESSVLKSVQKVKNMLGSVLDALSFKAQGDNNKWNVKGGLSLGIGTSIIAGLGGSIEGSFRVDGQDQLGKLEGDKRIYGEARALASIATGVIFTGEAGFNWNDKISGLDSQRCEFIEAFQTPGVIDRTTGSLHVEKMKNFKKYPRDVQKNLKEFQAVFDAVRTDGNPESNMILLKNTIQSVIERNMVRMAQENEGFSLTGLGIGAIFANGLLMPNFHVNFQSIHAGYLEGDPLSIDEHNRQININQKAANLDKFYTVTQSGGKYLYNLVDPLKEMGTLRNGDEEEKQRKLRVDTNTLPEGVTYNKKTGQIESNVNNLSVRVVHGEERNGTESLIYSFAAPETINKLSGIESSYENEELRRNINVILSQLSVGDIRSDMVSFQRLFAGNYLPSNETIFSAISKIDAGNKKKIFKDVLPQIREAMETPEGTLWVVSRILEGTAGSRSIRDEYAKITENGGNMSQENIRNHVSRADVQRALERQILGPNGAIAEEDRSAFITARDAHDAQYNGNGYIQTSYIDSMMGVNAFSQIDGRGRLTFAAAAPASGMVELAGEPVQMEVSQATKEKMFTKFEQMSPNLLRNYMDNMNRVLESAGVHVAHLEQFKELFVTGRVQSIPGLTLDYDVFFGRFARCANDMIIPSNFQFSYETQRSKKIISFTSIPHNSAIQAQNFRLGIIPPKPKPEPKPEEKPNMETKPVHEEVEGGTTQEEYDNAQITEAAPNSGGTTTTNGSDQVFEHENDIAPIDGNKNLGQDTMDPEYLGYDPYNWKNSTF